MGTALRDEFVQLLKDVGENHTAEKILSSRGPITQEKEIPKESEKEVHKNQEKEIQKDTKNKVVGLNKKTGTIKNPGLSFDQMRDRANGKFDNDPGARLASSARAIARDKDVIEKNKAKRERKQAAGNARPDYVVEQEKPETPLESKDVQRAFWDACYKKWPEKSWLLDEWDGASWGIAGRLCKRWTPELTVVVVSKVIENWEAYVKRHRITLEPDMKVFAIYAKTWFPMIRDGSVLELSGSSGYTDNSGKVSRWVQGEWNEKIDNTDGNGSKNRRLLPVSFRG
jgi:hypothetical protein